MSEKIEGAKIITAMKTTIVMITVQIEFLPSCFAESIVYSLGNANDTMFNLMYLILKSSLCQGILFVVE